MERIQASAILVNWLHSTVSHDVIYLTISLLRELSKCISVDWIQGAPAKTKSADI